MGRGKGKGKRMKVKGKRRQKRRKEKEGRRRPMNQSMDEEGPCMAREETSLRRAGHCQRS